MTFRRHFPSAAAVLVIGGFVLIAAQNLASFPIPDTDEAMTLQIPYEMLNRGKLAFPMYQFMGGNIENSWHSLTPVFFVILSGFMKVVGWGLLQGREFNLGCAAIALFLIYLIGRRVGDWQVGLIAVVIVICDPLFLSRSRLVRNDLLAVVFGLLSFYLLDLGLERAKKAYFLGSGLAAGAAVMCHTNLIYILIVLAVLMTLKHRRSIAKSRDAWLVAGGAFAVMAYEIIYALVDYRNLILQNRGDTIHFRVMDPWGWWENLRDEPHRYLDWYQARGIEFVPQGGFQRVFLLLTVVAIFYLIVRASRSLKPGAILDQKDRLLIATGIVVLFFAVIVQRKVTQYIVYLAPWFALCVAVMIRDGLASIKSLKDRKWSWAKSAQEGAIAITLILFGMFVYQVSGRYFPGYLRQAHAADLPSFEEIREVMRSSVPDGLCPAAIGNGYLWLAFPEHDRCFFAHMEHNLDERLGLDGKDYALFVRPKSREKVERLTAAGAERYHLLAELRWTAYGSFKIYYTGDDLRYKSLPVARYYFFGHRRGHVNDAQIAAGSVVWDSASIADWSAPFTLKPFTVYHFQADEDEQAKDWSVDLVDDNTGEVIEHISPREESLGETVGFQNASR